MRPLRSWSLLLLALSATACRRDIPSLETWSNTVPALRLSFQPPEDRLLTETIQSTLRREGAPGEQVAEVTTTTRFTPEPQGWLLTQQVTRAHSTREGTPVKTLVEDVLLRAPLRARLAADGTFVRLVDPSAALTALTEVAPAGVDVSPLARLLAPDVLEARARAEWEVKYGNLFGRALDPGQLSHAVGTLALGEREVTYLLERRFTGTQSTLYGEAAGFSLRCLEAPGEEAPPDVRDVLRRAGDPTLTPGVTCEGEQLLGQGRFLPVRRVFTLRAVVDGESWTWATQSALESLRTPEEEAR